MLLFKTGSAGVRPGGNGRLRCRSNLCTCLHRPCSGTFDLSTVAEIHRKELKADAEYYRLPGLVELIQPTEKELAFTAVDDTNGLFFCMGTNGGTAPWVSPTTRGVVVTASDPGVVHGSLAALVDRGGGASGTCNRGVTGRGKDVRQDCPKLRSRLNMVV